MQLTELTRIILEKVPAALLPDERDARLVQQYRLLLANYETALVEGFYDTVFDDANTRHYLSPEQRKQREQTLRQWYQITIHGNFDAAYWQWQAFVGVVHVKHGISNAAMLGMWGWIINFLQDRLLADLPLEEASALLHVLHKLQVVVSSLVVESYILTEREAIKAASGLNSKILGRFIHIEIDRLLQEGRRVLQNESLRQAA